MLMLRDVRYRHAIWHYEVATAAELSASAHLCVVEVLSVQGQQPLLSPQAPPLDPQRPLLHAEESPRRSSEEPSLTSEGSLLASEGSPRARRLPALPRSGPIEVTVGVRCPVEEARRVLLGTPTSATLLRAIPRFRYVPTRNNASPLPPYMRSLISATSLRAITHLSRGPYAMPGREVLTQRVVVPA